MSNKDYNVWDRNSIIIIEERKTGECYFSDEKETSDNSIEQIVELRKNGIENPNLRQNEESC